MTNKQTQQKFEIGMVGLGVMGRNLVLNMADHNFSVAGYDKDPTQVAALRKESAERSLAGTANVSDFGAHTYERNDALGTFHTEWESEAKT